MPPTTADDPGLMVEVVNRGTGTAAQIDGVHRRRQDRHRADGGRRAPHAWFVAFAPAEAPQYAVSVIVEHGGTPGARPPVARSPRRSPRVLQFLLGTNP